LDGGDGGARRAHLICEQRVRRVERRLEDLQTKQRPRAHWCGRGTRSGGGGVCVCLRERGGTVSALHPPPYSCPYPCPYCILPPSLPFLPP
jgi:hypothetical protein